MSNRPRGGPDGVQPPRRRRRARRAWTKRRRAAFLETLAESCNVSAAARAAGMDRSSAHDLKDRDPEFQRGWRMALEHAYSALEWELLKDAKEGSVRTEVTVDPRTGETTKVKFTHERPHTVSLRLLLSHKDEVAAFRVAEAPSPEDPEAAIMVRQRMDHIRALLLKHAATKTSGDGDDKGDGA